MPSREASLIYTAWLDELPADHPDRDYLLEGIQNGFHIVHPTEITEAAEVENYKSATDPLYRDKVEEQIFTELENGRYQLVDEKPTIISALGAIPKRNSDKVRLIHDASRPQGSALNDFAPHERFSYQSIQDAVDLTKPGYYYAKVDLANAYRSVRIHPSNYSATGLKWTFAGESKPRWMIDRSLPFGARASPFHFNKLSQAVRDMMQRRGFQVVAYLDDFLIVAPTYATCLAGLNTLISLLRKLGFHINYSKVEGPLQRIVFLGLVLDSVNRTLEIPQPKLQEMYQELTLSSRGNVLLSWSCSKLLAG